MSKIIKIIFLLLLVSRFTFDVYSQDNIYATAGRTKVLEWKSAGDYSAYNLLFVVVDGDDDRIIQKTLTKSYLNGYTTMRCTLFVSDTEDLTADASYNYDIAAYGTDTITVRSGLLNLIDPVQTSFNGTNLPGDGTRFYVAGTFIDTTVADGSVFVWDSTNQTMNAISKDSLLSFLNITQINVSDSVTAFWDSVKVKEQLALKPSSVDIVSGIKDYTKGSKIQNLFYKINTNNLRFDDTIRVRVMGNSISAQTASWGYFPRLDTLLPSLYPNVNWDIQNISYGGYTVPLHHALYFEDAVINPNIDLWVFAEHEGGTFLRNTMTMDMFKKIREKSTADIIVLTYSPAVNGGVSDSDINLYRQLANYFSCELLDTYKAFSDTIVGGVAITDLLSDNIHPNSRGQNIYFNEFNNLFDTDYYTKLFLPNPLQDVESVYELETPVIYKDSSKIKLYGTFTNSQRTYGSGFFLNTSTLNDSLQFTFDGVGFDLYYYDSTGFGNFDIYIDDQKPSDIRISNLPLEYATPVLWDNNNAVTSGLSRVFKAIVKDTTSYNNYYLKVTDDDSLEFYIDVEEEDILGSELISSNTDFESYTGTPDDGTNDSFTGWSISTNPNGTIEATATSHAGSIGVKLTNTSTTTGGYIRRQITGLSGGETLRLQFYGRGDGYHSIVYALYTNAFATIISGSTDNTSTTYSLFSRDGVNPAGNTSVWVYISISSANTGVTPKVTYVDDISLKEVTSISDILLGTYSWNDDIETTDILIPEFYAGSNNWIGTANFVTNDKLTFSINRNWVDNVECNGTPAYKSVRIFGLENKGHTLSIINKENNKISLDAVKVFRPILGRK